MMKARVITPYFGASYLITHLFNYFRISCESQFRWIRMECPWASDCFGIEDDADCSKDVSNFSAAV